MDETVHAGHRERLRERYRREGLSGFAPHEVLELLLTYAIPRIDTNALAHGLIERFGSLGAVLEASPEELEKTPGIGPCASSLVSMLVPLFRKYEQEKLLPRQKLGTYADLAAYCRALYLGVGHEQFYVLCFDAQFKLLSACRLADGTPGEVTVAPRMVLREALRRDALGAVISHNHPSGSPFPSEEDIALTREIHQALAAASIRLYDHVIIAGSQDYSFFAHHLLEAGPAAPLFPAGDASVSLAADRPDRLASGAQQKR